MNILVGVREVICKRGVDYPNATKVLRVKAIILSSCISIISTQHVIKIQG